MVCPRSNTLSNGVATQSIDHKSMQVLLLLIAHRGKTVSKDRILETVWQGKFVTEDILSVTVSKIRKALGDSARRPTFIKTLSGKGYELIAEVITLPPESDSREAEFANNAKDAYGTALPVRSSVLAIFSLLLLLVGGMAWYFHEADNDKVEKHLNISSIAVLPFDDLSSASDNSHFTDGLSDAIIHQLSQIDSLKVISRYSSFAYRGQYNATDIGTALGVDTLLDGSVQKVGNQIRINVRIFSTADGQQLWSRTFDAQSRNSFALQDTISSSIQSIIQPGYRPKTRSEHIIDAQAHEWYLLGQYLWRQREPESLEKAVNYFKKSLELEPDYVDAHIGLAVTYDYLHTYGSWDEKESIDLALPHINKALQLDPSSPRALAAKGLVLTEKAIYQTYSGNNDAATYEEAQQAFLQSLAMDNNAMTHQWYSALLRHMGNEADMLIHLDKAIELNPLSGALKRSYSIELLNMGRFDSAQRMLQLALDNEPDYFSRPVESSRINRYSPQSIMEMFTMHKENPEVFEQCTSVEYCEHLVFNYVSIGANDAAEQILVNMGATHFHFRTSLNAIAASERGDEQSALRIIEPYAKWILGQRRRSIEYAVAQFRAGEYSAAKHSILQLFPDWESTGDIRVNDITPDNYKYLLLYAAVLSKLPTQDVTPQNASTQDTAAPKNGTSPAELLTKVLAFLEQDTVFDKAEAEFTRAEINAQLGNQQQALIHLASALQMGWMETFNKDWWTLNNNHYLQSLKDETRFLELLEQHQHSREQLRDMVAQNISIAN